MNAGDPNDPTENRRTPASMYVEVDASPERLARIWGGVSERLERTRSPWWHWRGWVTKTAFALSVAVATATALFVLWQPPRTPSALSGAALETATDALSVDLEDGSKLELRAHTKVQVRESSNSAVVVALNRGSVRCDVVPDRTRSFEVLASGVRVRVTGTRFSVAMSEGGRVTVSVQSGSVEVTPAAGGDVKLLSAGESLSLETTDSGLKQRQADAHDVEPRERERAEPELGPTRTPSPEVPLRERPAEPASDERAASEPVAVPESTKIPLGPRELFDKGNASRRQGDAAGAARAYEQLIATHPSDPRAGLAAFELGRLRMDRLGDLQGAVVALRRAVTMAPGAGFKEDAMARLVHAYAAMGASDSCHKARTAYLDAFPSGVHATSIAQKCAAP